jgi:hypothetical protein
LQPEVQYVYDLRVGEEVVLRPNDGEVEGFRLMPLHEVLIPFTRMYPFHEDLSSFFFLGFGLLIISFLGNLFTPFPLSGPYILSPSQILPPLQLHFSLFLSPYSKSLISG